MHLLAAVFCPTTKKRQMKKEAEKYVRQQNFKSQNENLSNDEKILISMLCEFSKLQVKKKKQSILRIAKKYRRYENGVDKNGFVYISQLEAICR